MDNIQCLFVRACKSSNALERIQKLYSKFYLSNEFDSRHVAGVLLKIVEDSNNKVKPSEWVDYLNPSNHWKIGAEGDQYYTVVMKVLISHIRLTVVSDFNGYKIPAKFKEKTK